MTHSPEHWCKRATEMRAAAVNANDPTAKATMLKIATEYDKLARRAGTTRRTRPSGGGLTIDLFVPPPGKKITEV